MADAPRFGQTLDDDQMSGFVEEAGAGPPQNVDLGDKADLRPQTAPEVSKAPTSLTDGSNLAVMQQRA